jgi:hypothetical protein
MPVFDDDDDFQNFGETSSSSRRNARGRGEGRGDEWSVEDEGPDDRDLVPDEMTTVRCTRCGKLIFEDLVRCPYCREMQLEAHRNRKPLWFLVTVIFCVIATGGVSILWLLGLVGR